MPSRSRDRSFHPGQVLVRRYKVHRRIGSGSMGDVYRVLDTSLGTVVALKIPTRDHPNYSLLEGLLPEEVRLAQRVSHPNVCRVVDLVIDEKLMALSMEYIDGDTLETLLRERTGALSAAERLRIAREMCAGLAAIHGRDLIHRDLKPANVMIDSQGRTVVVDFGLAAEHRAVFNPKAGAEGYKAPEQIRGEEITYKVDLYALGLVLAELLAGEHPNEEGDLKDLTKSLEGELAVSEEQAAELAQRLRECLAEDPGRRPRSAEDVARALPCVPSDPARDAATPVYRLLTGRPGDGLRRPIAWAGLGATLLGLWLVALLSQWTQPTQAAVRGEPPSELKTRAQEILARLGFDASDQDRRSGFTYVQDPERPVRFWYRQSPARLAVWRQGSAFHRYEDPPFSTPGEVGVHLDPQGRLLRLDTVPAETGSGADTTHGDATHYDWKPLLLAAGLDPDLLRPVEPRWRPPGYVDQRAAWTVDGVETYSIPHQIEAGALGGRPAVFRILSPEPSAPRFRANAEEARRGPSELSNLVHGLGFGGLLLGVLWLARQRLRERVADQPAAFRLAVFVFVARVLVGLLGFHHGWSLLEFDHTLAVFSRALLSAALVWIIYIAVEPWVRYHSSELTASWIRLMYGNWRDPLVGRDLLVGGLFGVAVVLWARLVVLVPTWLGLAPPRADRLSTLVGMLAQDEIELQVEALSSIPRALGVAAYAMVHAVLLVFLLVSVIILLRRVLMRAWLSRSLAFVLYLIMIFPRAGHPLWDLVAATGVAVLAFTVLFRFGFLATVTTTAFAWWLSSHPLTLDPTSWAFEGALVPLLLTLGVSIWGFWASLGDRSPLPEGLLRLRRQSG